MVKVNCLQWHLCLYRLTLLQLCKEVWRINNVRCTLHDVWDLFTYTTCRHIHFRVSLRSLTLKENENTCVDLDIVRFQTFDFNPVSRHVSMANFN